MQLVTVPADNAPGSLAKITAALHKAKVDVRGFSAFGDTVHIVTEDVDEAVAGLEKAGYEATYQNVQEVRVPDKPGGLASMTKKLAEADINITMAFGSAGDARMYILTDDASRAEGVLEDLA